MSFSKFCRVFITKKSPQHGCFDVRSTFQKHGSHHGLHWQQSSLMQQYDELVVMPLLKVVMRFLNLDQAISSNFPSLELLLTSTRLFGSITST